MCAACLADAAVRRSVAGSAAGNVLCIQVLFLLSGESSEGESRSGLSQSVFSLGNMEGNKETDWLKAKACWESSRLPVMCQCLQHNVIFHPLPTCTSATVQLRCCGGRLLLSFSFLFLYTLGSDRFTSQQEVGFGFKCSLFKAGVTQPEQPEQFSSH